MQLARDHNLGLEFVTKWAAPGIIEKQAQMCDKLRQFRVEDIYKGKSAGVKIKVTYRSS